MTLIAAAVRHAITLKPKEAERMIALFKRMLPDHPAALASIFFSCSIIHAHTFVS
ncbi:hypothetical protein [Afipia broomeae]